MHRTNIKLGIFSWFGYRIHMADRARMIKEAGFEVTSIWWGEEERANTGSLHDLPEIIRWEKLELDNIHVPFSNANDIWNPHKDTRKKMIQQYVDWLNDCQRHKIAKMVMHLCSGENCPDPNDCLLDSLTDILSEAEKLGVILAVENTRRADYIDFVFSNIDSPHLYFCYDSSHDFLWSPNPTGLLKKWGRKLIATHISDNDGQEDSHWLVHTGSVDWQRIAETFPIQTYNQPLMLELITQDNTLPPEVYLKEAFKGAEWFTQLLRTVEQTTQEPAEQ
ncbi:MAG: sugar phosphate isomerase/epimerase [Planctomycetota bacterium]